MQIYAIIKSGRREYRVFPGKVVKIDRMEAEPGEIVEFGEVSKLVNGNQVATGQPLVKGARVRAQVVKHGQEKGIIVFKMKRRRIFRNKFDRQREFTSLKVLEIVSGDAVFGKQQSDPRKIKRAKAAAKASEAKKAKAILAPEAGHKPQSTPSTPAPGEPKKTPAVSHTKEEVREPISESGVAPVRQSPPSPVTTGKPQEQSEASNTRSRIVATLIALVILLALAALFWDKQRAPQSTDAQIPKVETPAEIKLRQTGQVDKPSAPATPPK